MPCIVPSAFSVAALSQSIVILHLFFCFFSLAPLDTENLCSRIMIYFYNFFHLLLFIQTHITKDSGGPYIQCDLFKFAMLVLDLSIILPCSFTLWVPFFGYCGTRFFWCLLIIYLFLLTFIFWFCLLMGYGYFIHWFNILPNIHLGSWDLEAPNNN